MNIQPSKSTKKIRQVRVFYTLAALCLLQPLIANVSFAQAFYSAFSHPAAAMTDPKVQQAYGLPEEKTFT